MATSAQPDAGYGRVFYGWWIVGALAITQTVGYGVLYYAFAVFLTPIRQDLDLGTAQVTGAMTLCLLVAAVAAVPVGRWLDRRGGRALMTAGSVAASLLVVAWAHVSDMAGLYLVFAGIGLTSAMVLYEPAFAVVVTWFARRRALALLAVTVVAGFASTVFMPLSAQLLEAYGWRTAVLVLGIGYGLVAVPLHLLVRGRPADLGLHPDGDGDGDEDEDSAVDPVTGAAGRTEVVRGALRDAAFWALTASFVTHAAAVSVVGVHLVACLLELGHSAGFAATVAGLVGILSVTGRLVTTAAGRLPSPALVVGAIFLVQALACLGLPLTGRSPAGAVGSVIGIGFGFGVATIARPALLAERYGTIAYGTLSGVLAFPLTVARAFAPLGAAAAQSAAGSYRVTALALALALAFVVAAATLLLAVFLSRSPFGVQGARL